MKQPVYGPDHRTRALIWTDIVDGRDEHQFWKTLSSYPNEILIQLKEKGKLVLAGNGTGRWSILYVSDEDFEYFFNIICSLEMTMSHPVETIEFEYTRWKLFLWPTNNVPPDEFWKLIEKTYNDSTLIGFFKQYAKIIENDNAIGLYVKVDDWEEFETIVKMIA